MKNAADNFNADMADAADQAAAANLAKQQ